MNTPLMTFPPPRPTGHHADKWRFSEIAIDSPRTGCSEAEARASTAFSVQNKKGIRLMRRKQPDGTYTIWRVA